MYGPLHIEDGTTPSVTLGIDLTETMLDVPMRKLVGNTDLTEAEGPTSTEMIDV